MLTLPVALQLYTVRDYLDRDLCGTLQTVKTMGYDYVEPAGLGNIDPKYYREALDAAGLKAVCAHVPLAEFDCDDIAAVVDKYITLGCTEYLAIPYLAGGQRPGDEGFDEILAKIAKIAEVCASKGITLLYHNHDFEFVKMPDGSFGLDYMYSKVPALAAEFDTCWVKVAGEEPTEYLKNYRGRCPVVHLKDFVGSKTENMYALIGTDEAKQESSTAFEFRPVGHGVQDIPAILKAARENNADYVVVEQDMWYGMSSLEAAKLSRDYLKTLGW